MPSADGTEVVDADAGLSWPRCDEGMTWTGSTCTGEPILMTRAEALSLASARRRAAQGHWRLPRAGELRALVVRHGGAAGLDPRLFPAAPRGWHWTGSAQVDTGDVNGYAYDNIQHGVGPGNANRLGFLHGWAVQLGTGQASGEFTTRTRLAVRLVRELPPRAPAGAASAGAPGRGAE